MASPNPEVALPSVGQAPSAAARRVNSPWAGYWHLVGSGLKLLRREPQAIFWVFVFLIFMAIGLGLATRNRPPDAIRVAVVTDAKEGGGSRRALALLKPSIEKGYVLARALPADEALDAFRLGKYDLVVTPRA